MSFTRPWPRFGNMARIMITVLCLFLCGAAARAQDGSVPQDPLSQTLSGSAGLVKDATMTMTYPAAESNELSAYIQNIIILGVNEESTIYIPGDFTVTVSVRVDYGSDAGTTNFITQDLTVEYKAGTGVKYKAKNYIRFFGARYVKVSITSAPAITAPSGFDPLSVLTLQSEMHSKKYFALGSGVLPTITASPLADSPVPDELPISWTWPSDPGSNQSQLEWTWLEDDLASNYTKSDGSINYDLLFRNNATRVDFPFHAINTYAIPLFYSDQGKLYYRIRAVNTGRVGNPAYGSWSTVQSYAFGGHNDSLNWQVSTSFAEEGKRKSVMQYFDGSLRMRQTVTKDNSTNTTVSAETFYDGQGRPAVQILPAPGINSILSYTHNLNLFNGQTASGSPAAYDDPAGYFDLEPVTVSGMNPSTGAAQYYSAANPEIVTDDKNKNLPDAQGYPYSVTQYTPDATGRVMVQSGVGSAMKMGSGHETHYYYGNASQEELDGLFGTEAGIASHYFKNMVQDANGQMSVSYVDMHGRTVATALAGVAPAGMTDLDASQYPGQGGNSMTRSLLDKNSNVVKENSLESLTSLLVPVREPYAFTYALTPDKLQLVQGGTSTVLCYDCMYDLEISITDESGKIEPMVWKFTNVNLQADDDCSTPAASLSDLHYNAADGSTVSGNTISFTKTLPVGSYAVRKTLTLSEASRDRYRALYLSKNLTAQQDIIDSLYSNILLPASNCAAPSDPTPCESCKTALGTFDDYKAAYNANLVSPASDDDIHLAYNSALARCNGMCANISHELPNLRSLMLSDMMPYSGQYAQDPAHPVSTVNDIFNKYNIFSVHSPAIAHQPFFRNPKNEQANAYYYDEAGHIDLSIQPDGTNTLLQSVTQGDYVNMFSSSWAESLLPYHPEYARLQFAESNLGGSYDWIDNFNAIDTYAGSAGSATTLYPTTTGDFEDYDPFFTVNPSAKTTMKNMATTAASYNGLSLWQIAYGMVMCNTTYPGGDAANTCTSGAPLQPPFSGLTDDQMNLVWNNFKGLYASARNSLVNDYIKTSVPLADEDALVDQGYLLRFPTSIDQVAQQYQWEGFTTTPSGSAPDVDLPAQATAVSASRCSSYIDQWKRELSQCAALTGNPDSETILNEITAGMELVCEKGQDEANPYGSSSVAPATPNDGSPRDFETVIANVFAAHGISKDQYCNPFVIEFPKPYGKNPVFTKEVITQLDDCNCQQFATIRTAAAAAGYDPSQLESLNLYLTNMHYDVLTQVLFDGLQNCNKIGTQVCYSKKVSIPFNCDGEGNPLNDLDPCFRDVHQGTVDPSEKICTKCCPIDSCVLVQYIPLVSGQPKPAFLNCGFTDNSHCLTCAQISTLTANFKVYYGGQACAAAPVLSTTNLSADQIGYNTAWAQYINYYTGLQLSWMEYTQAASANTCNLANYASNGSNGATVICGNTQPLNDTTGMIVQITPCQRVYDQAIAWGTELYEQRRALLIADFDAAYRAKCLSAASIESFKVQYTNSEYHYTLYYYDMAENLVRTVPPKGARPDFSSTFVTSVEAARPDGIVVPSHELITYYWYNSLNEVVKQKTPDADTARFWYDRLARLAVSQNGQQAIDGKYSYTQYDALGRITEVGQKPQTTPMTQTISQNESDLSSWINMGGGTREQITATVYDQGAGSDGGLTATMMTQNNLRNRVSYTYTKNFATDVNWYHGTYYTYDVHGNVDTLLQNYLGVTALGDNHFKRICYDYDLISGKVNGVDYQPGAADAFYHRYLYDAENRLTEVTTSRDSVVWESEAKYSYYKHGPLARSILGKLQVQGLDYSYTLQGWLKGINMGGGERTGPTGGSGGDGGDGGSGETGNSGEDCPTGTALDDAVVSERSVAAPSTYPARNSVTFVPEFTSGDADEFETVLNTELGTCTITGGGSDPGGDPGVPEIYPVGQDAYNMSLHYYTGDYLPVGSPVVVPGVMEGLSTQGAPLYNGNIAAMSVSMPKLGDPKVYNYHYDQLNRLKQMDAFSGLNNATGVFTPLPTNDYKERAAYDPNGNILTYLRNGTMVGGTTQAMDDLTYNYTTATNRLQNVQDAVTTSSAGYTDIKNGQGTNNYTYDAIGNLIGDYQEGIGPIHWTVYGKIADLAKGDAVTTYTYDVSGNRITKAGGGTQTIYVRDAQGNVMSVYQVDGGGGVQQVESDIYGSSRLGLVGAQTVSPTTVSLSGGYDPAIVGVFTRGEKVYELSNHLGNVLATVTDKKISVPSTDNSSLIDHYEADVASAQDYYPFGMEMPGRVFNNGGYRYGFNGKENDNEVKGVGNQIDYGMRVYDPRIGKFLSIDPLTSQYPFYSPFEYAGNSPIKFIDLDGGETKELEKNWANQPLIDMRNAPSATSYNAAGYARNANWAFKEQLRLKPEMFSESNKFRINVLKINPIVDKQWVKYNSEAAGYMYNTLVSHHINGENMGVSIPEQLHYDRFSDLHPYINAGKAIKGAKISGILSGTATVVGNLGMFSGAFTGDPESWINGFSGGEPKTGDIKKDWIGGSGLYVQIMSITEHYIPVFDDNGAPVIDQETGMPKYRLGSKTVTANNYTDYIWDDDKKKFQGINKVGSETEEWKYDEKGSRIKENVKSSSNFGMGEMVPE